MAASKTLTPEQRSQRARLAAHSRWAVERDRRAATAAARAKAMKRFEREVDPNGELDPVTRAKLAESAKSAYFSRLAFESSKARSRKAA
jgi:hypothetical protein